MHISEIFINRPVGTYLIMLALLIFGWIGYYLLPISQLPDFDLPTIVVNAALPGTSPETMATAVATPLEKRFANISGIDSITSKSSLGITQIILQFSLNKNIDAASLDVQAAITASAADLPSNMSHPPVYMKINPAEAPILYLAMYSDTAPLFTIDDYAEKLFGQNLSMINGVSQVGIYGSQKYATRIQLDPTKLSTYNLSFLEVKQAIAKSNLNISTGSLSTSFQEIPLQVNSQLEELPQYQDLIIAFRNGNPIKLHQIGRVRSSVENNKVGSWFNNKRSIILVVQKQPGANTLNVITKVYAQIEKLKKQLPSNINIVPVYDRSPIIKSSIHDVQITLIISINLVVGVIFFFLRNFRAAIIIGLVLPFSLIGTFAFMHLLGYSLNIISLLALTLVVGFVVDDAIVVLENITRHLEQGKSLTNAALIGSKEITFTIITMTLSLIIVFIPILFIGGIIGKIFHEFAMTSVITILLSGIISLSLTPMLASKFLHLNNDLGVNKIFKLSNDFNDLIFNYYKKTLDLALNHKKYILYIFLCSIFLTMLLFKYSAKSFIPEQDVGNFICFTEADPDISFDLMAQKQREISNIIREHQAVESVIYNVGAGGLSQTMNAGSLIVKLKPYNKRRDHVKTIINQLRNKVNSIPGIKVYLQNIQTIQLGSKISKGIYQYVLLDPDLAKLQHAVTLIQNNLESLPELQDVSNDAQNVIPQLTINVDRNKAGRLEISMEQIANTLYNAFGNAQISNLYLNSDIYKIILEVSPEYNNKISLENLKIRSNNGKLVSLNSIATFKFNPQLLTVNHQGQIPAATISFNLHPGKSLSQALTAIENTVKKLNLPESLVMQFSGVAQNFKSSIQNLLLLLCIVGLAIYILLGILYESFIHPLTVLSGLPTAFLGALAALYIFNVDLDLYGFIGLIILMGIVKKNAIMMIDFALEEQRQHNLSAQQAIYNACLVRFRPIIMTTMAAILGGLPIALGLGSAAIETQRSLGLAVVGGLCCSQVLTLYITPVIYIYLAKLDKFDCSKNKNY